MAREVEAEYLGAVTEAIKRFGGYLAKYLGDGVLAYSATWILWDFSSS